MPGRWLLALSRLVFDDAVRTAVIEQTIADMRVEWIEAGPSFFKRVRARWRGYLAFWSLIVMAPVAFRNWPTEKATKREFWRVGALAMVLTIVAIAWRTTLAEWLAPILNNLPEGTMSAIGRAGAVAFLAGPFALAIAAISSRADGRERFRARVPAMVFLTLLSIPAAALIGTAGVIGTFEGIGRSGSAGLGTVSHGIASAIEPLPYAIVAASLGLLVCAALAVRSQPIRTSAETLRSSLWRDAALSVLLLASLVAVDLLLRQQHEMLTSVRLLFSPADRTVVGGAQLIAQRSEEIISLLLFGATALTLLFVIVGLTTWRARRESPGHPILMWTSRVAVFGGLAGSAWHATVIHADVAAIRALFTAAQRGL